MSKKQKTLFAKHHLDFAKRDFAVVIAGSLAKGEKVIQKRLGITLNLSEQDRAAGALSITMDNGAVVLLFRFDNLFASTICHEVTHATNGMFDHIGIKLNLGSDEAFAYHNDMLFRTVAELLTENNVSIPLLPTS